MLVELDSAEVEMVVKSVNHFYSGYRMTCKDLVARRIKKGLSEGEERFLQDCKGYVNDAASVLDKLQK